METIDFIQRHMNEVLNECEKGSERHSAVKLAMVILQAEAKECEAIRYGTKISQLRKKWNRLSYTKKLDRLILPITIVSSFIGALLGALLSMVFML